MLTAGVGQNPARQSSIKAGLPKEVPALTINMVCGSSLKAVMLGAQAIKSGDAEIVIAGGQESMSTSPHVLNGSRNGLRMGDGKLVDSMIVDGLWDVYNDYHMGVTAENVAKKYGITRQEQDEFACASQNKAEAAQNAGKFADEIVPVTVSSRKGDVVVDKDEQPFNANIAKIPSLRPAFAKDGTITAANASSISDGASALVLTSAENASSKGLAPLAKIVAYASNSQHPSEFTIAPVGAIEKVLKKTGWNAQDVDL